MAGGREDGGGGRREQGWGQGMLESMAPATSQASKEGLMLPESLTCTYRRRPPLLFMQHSCIMVKEYDDLTLAVYHAR